MCVCVCTWRMFHRVVRFKKKAVSSIVYTCCKHLSRRGVGLMANFSGLSSRELLNKLFQERKNDGKIIRPLQQLTQSGKDTRSASGLTMCNCKKGKGKGVECRDHDFYETDFDTFDRSAQFQTFKCSNIPNVVTSLHTILHHPTCQATILPPTLSSFTSYLVH